MPSRVNLKLEDLNSLERASLLKFIREAHSLYVASIHEQEKHPNQIATLSFEHWLNLLTEGIHEANQDFVKKHSQ